MAECQTGKHLVPAKACARLTDKVLDTIGPGNADIGTTANMCAHS